MSEPTHRAPDGAADLDVADEAVPTSVPILVPTSAPILVPTSVPILVPTLASPFTLVGDAAPVCIDGVCELPPADPEATLLTPS